MISNLDNFLQIAVLLYIIYRMAPVLRKNRMAMTAVFFTFAVSCYLVSDLYWITHTLMMADARLPFAANEIGESGMFLLLAASLNAAFQESMDQARKEVAFTFLFAVASVGLWIGWSGEWVKDIISGLVFAYYLCMMVRGLKTSGAFSQTEWLALGLSSGLLIIVQTSIFFVTQTLRKPLDMFCYTLMFAWIIYFFYRTWRSIREKLLVDQAIGLSFAGMAWITSTMYMSADPIYFAADTSNTIMVLLAYIAVRRKVEDS